MFQKLIDFFRKVGSKMNLFNGFKEVGEHKKMHIDETAYMNIETNRQIYAGYVQEWHKMKEYTSQGEQKTRDMKRLGMGKVLAEKMARLIFNEKAIITISQEEPAKFVLETLENNGFHKNFQRYLEYGCALGGMAVKVYEHAGEVRLSYATADAFYPIKHDSENIDEALFINEEVQDGKFFTLMEFHEWIEGTYTITNELYRSEVKGNVGKRVPLDTLYEGLDDETKLYDVRRPIFVYFKLNTANNKNMQSPLGISIFENSYDTLYMIDYLYDFFWNEFKLGKRRITVPRSMLRPFIDAQGFEQVGFDPDETVFTPIQTDDEGGVKDLSVEIRATDIIQSINALLDMLSMQVGLSAGTFTFDGKSMKTATEVVSENSMTYQTKNSHEVLVEEGIKELITSIIDVAKAYKIYTGTDVFDVGINFDDSIAQDRDKDLNYYGRAFQMGLIPQREAIMRAYNIDKETALKWILEIEEDKQRKEDQLISSAMAEQIGADIYETR